MPLNMVRKYDIWRTKHGYFTDGDDEEDELFDLYVLNEIHERSNKGGSPSHSGGCLTSFLLIMVAPIGIVIGVISTLA